jgi:hypothetical protein
MDIAIQIPITNAKNLLVDVLILNQDWDIKIRSPEMSTLILSGILTGKWPDWPGLKVVEMHQ